VTILPRAGFFCRSENPMQERGFSTSDQDSGSCFEHRGFAPLSECAKFSLELTVSVPPCKLRSQLPPDASRSMWAESGAKTWMSEKNPRLMIY
jgi:hypothetical protein